MNVLLDIFKKPFVIIVLGLVVTLIVVGLVGTSFVLPQLGEISTNQQQTANLTAKDQKLAASIAQLKNLDKTNLTSYQQTLNSFFPEANDYLHFATLNETLTKKFGLIINSLTVTVAQAPSSTPTVGQSASGSTGGGAVAAAPATAVPLAISPGYYVLVSYKANWNQILNLLTSLKSLDRVVVTSKALFSVPDASGQLSVSITFFLPLSTPSTASASSESFVSLSQQDRDFLANLQSGVSYSAAPATDPLGKNDPFAK